MFLTSTLSLTSSEIKELKLVREKDKELNLVLIFVCQEIAWGGIKMEDSGVKQSQYSYVKMHFFSKHLHGSSFMLDTVLSSWLILLNLILIVTQMREGLYMPRYRN